MTSRMAKIIFNNPFFRVLSRFFGIIRDCSPPPLFATLHVGSHKPQVKYPAASRKVFTPMGRSPIRSVLIVRCRAHQHRQSQASQISAHCHHVNKEVLRYRSPVSGSSTTMVLPAFSGRFASSMAAQAAAPEEIPTSTPSDLPIRLPTAKASPLATGITSS